MGLGVAWTFTGNSGICSDGSAYGNINANYGTQCAFLQGAGSTISQSFTVTSAGTYTVSHRACERSWPDPNQDYNVLVDGVVIGHVVASQLATDVWTTAAFTVNLAAGVHTLTFQGLNTAGGDHTAFLDSVVITPGVTLASPGFEQVQLPPGSYVVRPPAVTTALVKLVAKVTTSGEGIYGQLVRVDDGKTIVPLVSIVNIPVIKVNGLTVIPGAPIGTPAHDGWYWPIPLKVIQGDTITLTARLGWATVAGDFAAAMDEQPIANCAGRSFTGADAEKATLKLGWNIAHGATPSFGTYSVCKNLFTRMMRYDPSPGVTAVDANYLPTALSQDSVTANFIETNNSNGLDDQGVPVPEGLYAVGWGATTPTTTCSLISADGDHPERSAVIVERTDLANPGDSSGNGKVRVFQVNRRAGANSATFKLSVQITDPGHAPRFSYLVVYGPGDFTATAPVVLDSVNDPAALSNTYVNRLGSGIGSMRFVDCFIGSDGSSVCEPGHLLTENRAGWFGWMSNWTVGFSQARPWTHANSPYVYSPLFGTPFAATLGQAMPTGTAGAFETYTFPDAATAPIIEGLVLTIGSERCRVTSVVGTSVTLERGSESTTPAAHAAGAISVSGRTAVNTLADWVAADSIVIELVATAAHKFRTGQQPVFDGNNPWPYFTATDGGQTYLTWVSTGVFVTGANTVVVIMGGATTHANVTLPAPVTLDPTRHLCAMHLPESAGMPYSVAARVAAASKADLHISIPFAASDSCVDAIARVVRDNYPAGRRVYVEYHNEPWNIGSYVAAMSQYQFGWLISRAPAGQLVWQTRRLGQVAKRFIDRFNENGLNRGGEVRSILNMQRGSGGNYRQYVVQARAEGLPVPDMAIAPYTHQAAHPTIVKALNTCTPGQAVDLWVYSLVYGSGIYDGEYVSPAPDCADAANAVKAVNTEFGIAAEAYSYECGVEEAWPQAWQQVTSAVAATDATINLDGTSLYSIGQYLRIDNEWVKVTSVSANAIGVARGQSGTTAAAHASGSLIRNAYIESGRDLVYNPLFRVAEFDQFALWQKYFSRVNISDYSLDYESSSKLWGMYHWLAQPAARGDARDGGPDHSLLTAAPGSPGMKPATTCQDLSRGSVRGRAVVDWNRWVRA